MDQKQDVRYSYVSSNLTASFILAKGIVGIVSGLITHPALCRLTTSAHALAVGWQSFSFPVFLKILWVCFYFFLTTVPISAS